MQALPSSGPSTRAVGLPSNPRQGRVLVEVNQPALAPAPVQTGSTRRNGQSSSGHSRSQVRPSAASRPYREPAPAAGPSINFPRSVSRPSPAGSQSSSRSFNAFPSAPPSDVRKESSTSSAPSSAQSSSDDDRPTWPPEGPIDRDEEPASSTSQDYQNLAVPLWNTVASLASNLSVNVNLPWYNSAEDGEETPVGSESRLTRAMKSYHLSKAQTHKDLPDWLFTDKERRSQPVVVAPSSQASDDDQPTAQTRQGGMLNGSSRNPIPTGRILGAERLKALRERRRFDAGM